MEKQEETKKELDGGKLIDKSMYFDEYDDDYVNDYDDEEFMVF